MGDPAVCALSIEYPPVDGDGSTHLAVPVYRPLQSPLPGESLALQERGRNADAECGTVMKL